MSDESQLQITREDGESSLVALSRRAPLIARGRKDIIILAVKNALARADSETRQLAEQGDAESQWSVGTMYDEGEGVALDHAEAARWYRKAAEQGFGLALQSLGRLYRDGRGVPQDFALAYMWFALAAAYISGDGQVEAARMRDDAARMINTRQIAEGQHLAREWGAAHDGRNIDFKPGQ